VTRRQQDICTWAVAIGILVSQSTPWVPEKPALIAGAFGLLGLPTIRKVQAAVNASSEDEEESG
jgi:hypothetical protein